jgi:hypothetical protein
MDYIASLPFVLIGLAGCANGMAVWRDKRDDQRRRYVEAVKASMRAAGITRDQAAAELEMDPSQYSRMVENGGNDFAFMVLGERYPVFWAALQHRKEDLMPADEDLMAKRERLLQELHSLPKRTQAKCEVRQQRDSSAA